MSIAIGIDLVGVDEVDTAIQLHGGRYLRRVYTEYERRECGGDARRLAARFAAKEATMKALGRSDEPLPWRCIGVRAGDTAQPTIELAGEAAALARAQGIGTLTLSITRRGSAVGAVVLAERAA